jgi:hypothetical protein
MALSSATVLEVRTTGVDTNGGGFVTGATGTDFSQQAAAQYSGTNLASTNGTTNPSVITSATHSFVATDVGNIIQITAGTNWTQGFYQIVSVAANAATLDRAVGTAAALSSGTFAVGGALLTIAKALAQMTVTGMQCYVRAGTYSISTALSTSAGINTTLGIARVIGYNTARGDLAPPTALTRPVIQTSAAVNGLNDANGGFRFENLTLDGNSTGLIGFNVSAGGYSAIYNCIVKGWTGNGVQLGASNTGIIQSEITTCAGSQGGVYLQAQETFCIANYIHANTTNGVFTNTSGAIIEDCVIASNTGAFSNGVFVNNFNATIKRNTIYSNGADGVQNTATHYSLGGEIANNILVNNTGYGLNLGIMSPTTSDCLIHHNAYFGNGTGATNHSNAGVGDVTLTGVPFTNAGGADFSLNNTTGQGAACRKAGYPGQMIGGGTGYHDIGALEAPPPNFVHPGMSGGMRG